MRRGPLCPPVMSAFTRTKEQRMRSRVLGFTLFVFSVAVLNGQAPSRPLPPDVNPVSLSRLPPVQRDSLDAEGKRIYDQLAGGAGKTLTATRSEEHTSELQSPYVIS